MGAVFPSFVVPRSTDGLMSHDDAMVANIIGSGVLEDSNAVQVDRPEALDTGIGALRIVVGEMCEPTIRRRRIKEVRLCCCMGRCGKQIREDMGVLSVCSDRVGLGAANTWSAGARSIRARREIGRWMRMSRVGHRMSRIWHTRRGRIRLWEGTL